MISYFLVVLFSQFSFSQIKPFRFIPADIPVVMNGKSLQNQWVGGLNASQYVTIDLNNDLQEDLTVFDRTNNKISTFLKQKDLAGNFYWKYSPEYESIFPEINNWMVLADYDFDGRKDLFTHGQFGVKVFRNNIKNDKINWEVIADPIFYENFNRKVNLLVNSADIPAITDVDNDGDLDILAFDATGDYVEYFQNMSLERSGKPNAIDFKKNGFCWGDFIKTHCKDVRFDIDCETGQFTNPNAGAKVLHSGNSILVADLTGDGLKDMLFGHITCDNIASMNNVGSSQKAVFSNVNYSFPENVPIKFPVFPAVYFEDFDFDGKKDLVATPNISINGTDYLADFQASNWLYKNVGTAQIPVFESVKKDFLQDQMIDLGENASPAVLDYDGDGDLDLIVGNAANRGEQGARASVYYFENTGDQNIPKFELKSDDFLNISKSKQLFEIQPIVVDIDQDGKEDLILKSDSFLGLEIRLIRNEAIGNKKYEFNFEKAKLLALPVNLEVKDNLSFVDYNKDGLMDLLVGKYSQGLELHKNIGTNILPKFMLVSSEYLGIDGEQTGTSSTVADLNGDFKFELISASNSGNVNIYQTPFDGQIPKIVKSDSLFVNSLTKKYEKGKFGNNLKLTTGDLNGDGLQDIVAGTNAGGLKVFYNQSEKVILSEEETILDTNKLFPIPNEGLFYFESKENGIISIFDLAGKKIYENQFMKTEENREIDIGNFGKGIYIFNFKNSNNTNWSKKILVE